MLAIIGVILILAWLAGLAFHVTTGVIHIAVVLGLVMLVLHFVRGRSATV